MGCMCALDHCTAKRWAHQVCGRGGCLNACSHAKSGVRRSSAEGRGRVEHICGSVQISCPHEQFARTISCKCYSAATPDGETDSAPAAVEKRRLPFLFF